MRPRRAVPVNFVIATSIRFAQSLILYFRINIELIYSVHFGVTDLFYAWQDGATLLAKIINSGPKPSDPPEEIWGRLLKKGHTDR